MDVSKQTLRGRRHLLCNEVVGETKEDTLNLSLEDRKNQEVLACFFSPPVSMFSLFDGLSSFEVMEGVKGTNKE